MPFSKSNQNRSKTNLSQSIKRTKSRLRKSSKPSLNEVIYLHLIDTSDYLKRNLSFMFIFDLLWNVIITVFITIFINHLLYKC